MSVTEQPGTAPGAGPRTPSVAICAATFRRPEGLKALLESLDAQELPEPAPKVRIVIVDNDAEAPVGPPNPPGSWSRHELTYVVEPTRGIVAARNRALQEAGSDVDYVIFIDDDETATPGWLAAMLETAETTGAPIVQGPVKPDFPDDRPNWAPGAWCFEIGPFKEAEPLTFSGTNNSLFRRSAVDALGRGFDMRFNLTGGEDVEFSSSILKTVGQLGATSANAVVRETVPDSRLTYKWVLQRAYRCGNTLGRLARMGRESMPKRAALSLLRMGRGLLRAGTVGLVKEDERVNGLSDVTWGAGTIAGLFGSGFEEYSPARRAKETARRTA